MVKGRSRESVPKGLSPGQDTGNGKAGPARKIIPLPNLDHLLQDPELNGLPAGQPAVIRQQREVAKIYIIKYPDAQDIVNNKTEPLDSFNIAPIRKFWPHQHAIFLDIPDSESFLIQPDDDPQPRVVKTVPLGTLWKTMDEREIKPKHVDDVQRVTRYTLKPRLLSTYDWALMVVHLCDLAGYLLPRMQRRS